MVIAQLEDRELIRRLKERDEVALEALMAQYGTKMFGLALRLTGNRQDAEEVLQDVFLTVFQKIDKFREESALSSWMYRITTNASLMKLRKRPKIREIPLEEELGPAMTRDGMIVEPVADWSGLPNEELDRKELVARLEEAVQKLPPDYRSVFVLRDVEGFSAEETGHVLQISTGALKSRLHRARLFLRKELTNYASKSQVPIPQQLRMKQGGSDA